MGFADSETVKKEVGAVDNFQEWIKTFALDNIPQKAIDELIQMTEVAEERSKIALIDLVRLLMQYEPSAAHILYKHWETFDISIFQYLLCMDIKDANNISSIITTWFLSRCLETSTKHKPASNSCPNLIQ